MHLPESARLVFRCWTEADLPLAQSLWADPEVTRHFGGPMSPETVRARLELEMERQRTLGIQYWPVFLRETGEFAGCSGLRPWQDEGAVRELGVHVMRRFWSMRLGEEASRAVTRFGFEELRLAAITAGHGPQNENSKAMLLRLGFGFTHEAPWGAQAILHPFYRLEREA